MFHDKTRFCANILRTLLNTRLIWTNFLLKLQEEFNLYLILLRTLSKVLSTVLCPKVKYTLYWVLYSVQSEVYFSWETSDQPKQLYLKKVTRRGRIPPSIIEEQAELYVLLFIEGTCDICHI